MPGELLGVVAIVLLEDLVADRRQSPDEHEAVGGDESVESRDHVSTELIMGAIVNL